MTYKTAIRITKGLRRSIYLEGVVEFASKMSYNDASLEFETATGVYMSERTIYGFVQEVAPPLLEAVKADGQPEMVMGDATKVRGLKRREMKRIHVLLSDGKRLLHLG